MRRKWNLTYLVFLFANLVVEITTFPFVANNYGLSPFIVSIFLLLVVAYPAAHPAFGIFEDDSIVLILSICGIIYVSFNANNLLLKSIGATEMNGYYK